MRKILILLVLALFSCENGLDVKPKMQIDTDDVFSNKENIYAALIGCYDALQLQHYYGRNLIIAGDMASDNSMATGTKIEYYSLDENSLLSDNILVEGIWLDIYTAINRVNYMIFELSSVEFLSPSELQDYLGQLKFLRALHYFNLVRLYGGLPLKTLPTVTDGTENYLARSSEELVYEQIISDLEFAAVSIKNKEPQKATQDAAVSLLASVYLTLANYEKAFIYASQILETAPGLEENYAELFSNSVEPSSEIIFYIPFSANDKNRMAEYHLPNQLGGRYENSPTQKLVDLIEPSDERKNLIASLYTTSTGLKMYYTTKYSNLTSGSDKVIVLRKAELYLIRAEANYWLDSIANQQLILDDINLVRNRANLSSIDFLNLTGSLINCIDNEKQIEFAFEGKRWFDLIRTNNAIGTVATVTEEYQMLFPIPLSEIVANPKIETEDQNEGY